MLKAATTATRAPRGTKPGSHAFFSAVETLPEGSRAAVAKAALTMIRDEMKTRRDKLKATAAKEKEKEKARTPVVAAKPVPAKRAAKAEPVVNGTAPAAPKRRGRKPAAETPTT